MEPTLRTTQVLKQEAEDTGLTGKEVAEYVTEQQILDREERAAWRDSKKTQAEDKKMQAQAAVGLAKFRAEADKKRRTDELQTEKEKRADEIHMPERADEIKIQTAQIEAATEQAKIQAAKDRAKIEADKEFTIIVLELKAQQD